MIDAERVAQIHGELHDYGHHRNELFMTRKIAKAAALLVLDMWEELQRAKES